MPTAPVEEEKVKSFQRIWAPRFASNSGKCAPPDTDDSTASRYTVPNSKLGFWEMKKILVAAALLGTVASAQAADLARKAPMLKAAPMAVYNWTGFYIGVNGGISVGKDRTSLLTTAPSAEQTNLSPFGAIGGGQAGFNWQVNSDWLLGIETDIQASGETTNRTCLLTCSATINANLSQKINWFGTTRARVGLVDGPVLSYLTGGVAYGHYSTTVTEPGLAVTDSRTSFGYTFGSGMEAALGGNWTGKIEYLYVDLGKRSTLFGTVAAPQLLTTRIHDNIFRAGVNYRFGGNGLVVTPPTANWSGFYIGANLGSLTGRDPSTLAFGGLTETFHLVPDGYAGGGQIGYNWQAGTWLLGVEADFQGAVSRDKDACVFCVGTASVNIKQTLPWYGTVRGRLGYMLGSTLFYGTGGFAYGATRTRFDEVRVPLAQSVTINRSRGGWTAGAGIESPLKLFGLFGPNWTAKSEYLYVDLGRTTDSFVSVGTPQTFTTRTQEHIFRGGINYHFNAPPPPVAPIITKG
jgi:outer membrane immunogenic protein